MPKRSRLPFGKFFWSDYASDPALLLCGYAAQGLWMRMLCIAAAHEPVGYVAVAGKPLDDKTIARMTGGALDEVTPLREELEENKVFSRDRRGWIYSRRMIRDAKTREKAQIDGKKGGNPRLLDQRENSGGVKGQVNQKANPHIPEANSDTNVSAVPAPSSEDLRTAIWTEGKALAVSAGKAPKQAGAIVGRWRNDAPDDSTLLEIIREATGKMDPLSWVPAALKGRAGGDPMAAMRREAERIARADQRRAA